MSNLFELLQMMALPASVLLVCRYLNRRADGAARTRRRPSAGRPNVEVVNAGTPGRINIP